MDAITRSTERRMIMTAEPITLLDLALGLMVLMMFIVALVAFAIIMKMFIKEFFGKKK